MSALPIYLTIASVAIAVCSWGWAEILWCEREAVLRLCRRQQRLWREGSAWRIPPAQSPAAPPDSRSVRRDGA